MKLKNLIALAAVAAVAAPAFADLSATEDLTSRGGDLVKNRWGECVTVNANKGLRDCGVQAPEPAPPPVMEMQREVITLNTDAYFDFDKYNLKPAGKQALQDLAGQLNQRGANIQKITVVGHTDSKGTDAYNQKLSERRASTVANYLAENGVPSQLIEAYGQGESHPVATNKTAEGRAQNRRVEVNVDGLVERQVAQPAPAAQ
ncbi:OmpA family protein [Cardiobacterium hominis]|uniref:Outer membrane protein A n=1 Tax=Cardiobacterium hominis TaxID=2718 RepID=A0A1C3H4N6_9GAMM|nr:OmpA family protein [Cardiobacterium hominis]SAM64704.1 Outer membrane protein A precursor [Cardiobacterium hominis]